MTDLDDAALWAGAPGGLVTPKKCRRHEWRLTGLTEPGYACVRCGKVRDEARAKTGRNNRKRGNSDELVVARLLGGTKVGPLGHAWDVEVHGYLRAQAKRLDRWPSLGKVIEWLDAIPAAAHLRAVTLADTPGPGKRTRRLIVMDLDEFAEHHGRVTK